MFHFSQILPLIPGRLAMPVMLCFLLLLVRRHRTLRGQRWVLPLFFLLLSQIGWAAEYVTRVDSIAWFFSHLFILDGQLLAAVTLAARRNNEGTLRQHWRFLLNAAGPLLFVSGYCFYSTSRAPYLIAASMLLASLLATARRHGRTALCAAAVMLGVTLLAMRHEDRAATYVLLASIYFFTLLRVRPTFPRDSVGRFAILGSLATWGMIFLLHPLLFHNPVWNNFLNNLWDLQPVFFSIGVLFLLLEKQLIATRSMALHDQLTGLPNRRLLDDYLEAALAAATRNSSSVAVLMLDLNGFKKINDTYGHPFGDFVLIESARRLRSLIHKHETLARLGGDEFILVSTRDRADLDSLKSEIRSLIKQPLTIQANEVSIDVSIGCAIFPRDCEGTEASRIASTLMHIADQRMYEQKALFGAR